MDLATDSKEEMGSTIEMDFHLNNTYSNGIKLIYGLNDSLTYLKSIPDGYANLIVSSPPYNVGKSYEERQTFEEYMQYQREVIRECVRILNEKGSIAWEVGNHLRNKEIFPLDFFFYKVFKEEMGLKLRNRIIWRFGHGLHASLRFSGRYETILWFTKGDEYTFNLDPVRVPQKYPGKRYHNGKKKGKFSGNPLGKNPGDVWDIILQEWEEGIWDLPNVKNNHPEKTSHPAQFPIELVQRLVLSLTNEYDTVVDPFGGVGTTALASVMLNRNAISIDRNKDYIDIAIERYKLWREGKLKIREIGTKLYEPNGKEKVSQIPEEWINEGRSRINRM